MPEYDRGGLVDIDVAEQITIGLGTRFLAEQTPQELTLMYADGKTLGSTT